MDEHVPDLENHDPAGRDWLVRHLEPLGADYELFACDPAFADTAAFCAAYGFDPEDSANTIVVIGKSDPARKAYFAPAEDTAAITGMQIGGVTVFGLPPDMPIWVDARVMERERVILGGGSRSWKVISTPSILTSLPRVEVVDGLANEPRPDA